MRSNSILAPAVLLAVLLAGCGAGSFADGAASSTTLAEAPVTTTTSTPPVPSDRPPDLRVVSPSDGELTLAPFGYCWFADGEGVCADGVPPDPLPTIALGEEGGLSLFFPLDWSMEVRVLPAGDRCDGVWTLEADPDGTPIVALGEAGTLTLDVFARGEQGDAAWRFEVVSTSDRPSRPSPEPYAQAYWFPSGGDIPTDAPFSVVVGNLTDEPESAAGSVKVTASNGAVAEVPLVPHTDGCSDSVISLDGPDGFSEDVMALGPPPYDLSLTLTLADGRAVSTETLTWPDAFPSDSNQSERVGATVDAG